ncbi:MAG: LLM class flavin-dependent oxidoreductase [Candidatus Binatia bacterium]
MKIRIGITLGEWPPDENQSAALLEFVERCENLDIDSVWVSDRIVSSSTTFDPIVLLAYLASRLRNMKFGTSALVLPTRQPVLLAKQLATLDVLCRGRLLLVAGLGGDDSRDFEAVSVRKEERGRRGDEAIVLMKKLWSEERVDFEGKFYRARNLTLLPRPYQKGGPPLWVGGRSDAALRRAGRLADGWLTSHSTPQEVEAGIAAIRRHAAEAGREVPDDHYGVLVPFFFAASMDEARSIAGPALRRRPDVLPEKYSALGRPEDVRRKLEEYVRAGATKFVMRPAGPRESLHEQVEILAGEVIGSLQTPFSQEERTERLG